MTAVAHTVAAKTKSFICGGRNSVPMCRLVDLEIISVNPTSEMNEAKFAEAAKQKGSHADDLGQLLNGWFENGNLDYHDPPAQIQTERRANRRL